MCGIGYILHDDDEDNVVENHLISNLDLLNHNFTSDANNEDGGDVAEQQQTSSSVDSSVPPMTMKNNSEIDLTMNLSTIEQLLEIELKKRGPDYCGILKTRNQTFISTVLSLRGDSCDVTKQPIENSDHILMWNGEIFDFPNLEDQLQAHNDTLLLFDKLSNIEIDTSQNDPSTYHLNKVLSIFNSIQGPFAFVYYNIKFDYLLFGRDSLGKRSLLYHYHSTNRRRFVLSSCAMKGIEFQSVPPGMFLLKDSKLKKFEYEKSSIDVERLILYKEVDSSSDDEYLEIVKKLYEEMSKSIYKRIHYLKSTKTTIDITLPTTTNSNLTNCEFGSNVTNTCKVGNIDNEASYAILFSGGIDSLVLAAISHLMDLENEKKISLLNVSFGNTLEQVSKGHDRLQSIQAYEMLNEKYGNRFNLILIDVLKAEVDEHSSIIKQLIYPNSTVLDYTIGCVLWFASRGRGYLYKGTTTDTSDTTTTTTTTEIVQSNSKVLLCGVGSDEIFGGYRRYLKRFKDQGWEGLNQEMKMDLNRLWFRNLGRDDRIISSHGRECRHPFLDESLLAFVQSLPLNFIVDLRDKIEFEKSEGCNNSKKFIQAKDKLLLRQMVDKLLKLESNQPKKAMQFASNVAKITLTTSRRKERGNKIIDQ